MSHRLQFVCTVTAEAHVTHSRIIFGSRVEDGGRMHSLSSAEVISMPASAIARVAVVQRMIAFCYILRKKCD